MQYSLLCIIIIYCECARAYNTCMQGVDITSTWLNDETRTYTCNIIHVMYIAGLKCIAVRKYANTVKHIYAHAHGK